MISWISGFRFRVIPLTLLVLLSQVTFIETSMAATVTAGGAHADPSLCNQIVSTNDSSVAAERLSSGDCLLTFKSGTNIWTPPSGISSVKVLVVGGGGGGGAAKDNGSGGGGGGGQVKENSTFELSVGASYTIVVGAGGTFGTGAAPTYPIELDANPGGNTTISINGSNSLVALGGNPGGGSRIVTPGAANSITTGGIGGIAATSSEASQGGSRGGGGKNGGGGGGSSGNGVIGAVAGGAGGAGTTSTILDTNSTATTTFGTGGAGGTFGTTTTGTSGAANSGIGARGAGAANGAGVNGGTGGSGVVHFRFTPAVPFSPLIDSIAAGNKLLTISFSMTSSVGVTDYEYSLNGGAYISAGTTTSPFTLSGLSGRTTYSVAIKARNSVGLGTASSLLSATTTDTTLDASEAAAETARVAAAAQATRIAREQRELTEIMAMIPKIGELTLSLGEVTRSLTSTQCIKSKTTKFVKKGAKCPKGFVRKR